MTSQRSLRAFNDSCGAAYPAQFRVCASNRRKNFPLAIAVAFGVSLSGWALIAWAAIALI